MSIVQFDRAVDLGLLMRAKLGREQNALGYGVVGLIAWGEGAEK